MTMDFNTYSLLNLDYTSFGHFIYSLYRTAPVEFIKKIPDWNEVEKYVYLHAPAVSLKDRINVIEKEFKRLKDAFNQIQDTLIASNPVNYEQLEMDCNTYLIRCNELYITLYEKEVFTGYGKENLIQITRVGRLVDEDNPFNFNIWSPEIIENLQYFYKTVEGDCSEQILSKYTDVEKIIYGRVLESLFEKIFYKRGVFQGTTWLYNPRFGIPESFKVKTLSICNSLHHIPTNSLLHKIGGWFQEFPDKSQVQVLYIGTEYENIELNDFIERFKNILPNKRCTITFLDITGTLTYWNYKERGDVNIIKQYATADSFLGDFQLLSKDSDIIFFADTKVLYESQYRHVTNDEYIFLESDYFERLETAVLDRTLPPIQTICNALEVLQNTVSILDGFNIQVDTQPVISLPFIQYLEEYIKDFETKHFFPKMYIVFGDKEPIHYEPSFPRKGLRTEFWNGQEYSILQLHTNSLPLLRKEVEATDVLCYCTLFDLIHHFDDTQSIKSILDLSMLKYIGLQINMLWTDKKLSIILQVLKGVPIANNSIEQLNYSLLKIFDTMFNKRYRIFSEPLKCCFLSTLRDFITTMQEKFAVENFKNIEEINVAKIEVKTEYLTDMDTLPNPLHQEHV